MRALAVCLLLAACASAKPPAKPVIMTFQAPSSLQPLADQSYALEILLVVHDDDNSVISARVTFPATGQTREMPFKDTSLTQHLVVGIPKDFKGQTLDYQVEVVDSTNKFSNPKPASVTLL